ncbi:PilN domain-containing protein [Candidatus Daviesbacteria bacterium]|nr:PilN domain-containing protein [Candidatus Daviesbacteria bacterium]
MAKSNQKSYSRLHLNLLYPQGNIQKWPLRFLRWLISYGRFIVVAVEILVLATFAMRFKLDNDLAKIKEQLTNLKPLLQNLSLDEALIRQTQLRFTTIKEGTLLSPRWLELLTKISDQTPVGVKVLTLSLDNDPPSSFKFKLTASTNSNNSLAVFLGGLKNEPTFKDVSLASVNYDQEQVVFTITGLTK